MTIGTNVDRGSIGPLGIATEASAAPLTQIVWTRMKALLLAYITWRVQQAAIRQLGSMSDRELEDIGLTRSRITFAVTGEAVRNRVFGPAS
jgi:uncharacterized protein YjiS (DUF1127 family)